MPSKKSTPSVDEHAHPHHTPSVGAALTWTSKRPATQFVGAVDSAAWWATLLCLLAATFSTAYFHGTHLPEPVPATAPADTFSEIRAFPLLLKLEQVANNTKSRSIALGRHTTTPAVAEAIKLLKSELHVMEQEADASLGPKKKGGRRTVLELEDGSHTVGQHFLDMDAVTVNMPFLAVRMSDGSERVKKNALIIDAHIDTQFFTLGTNDDGIWVATVMEVIRTVLNKEAYPYNHAVILLFSCEEEAIEGPRGFLSFHPWNKTVRAFINLEAGGTAARGATLLQNTGHWAITAFSKVKYPLGYPLSNDLFATGMVASATHYQVYKNFSLHGVDVVYAHGGWWYHTMLDDSAHIAPGAMQHGGENLMCLIDEMTKSEEFTRVGSVKGTYANGYVFVLVLTFIGEMITFVFFAACLFAIIYTTCRIDGPHMVKSYVKLLAVSVILVFMSVLVAITCCVVAGQAASWWSHMSFYSHIRLFLLLNISSALFGVCLMIYSFQWAAFKIVGPIISRRPSRLQLVVFDAVMIFYCLVFALLVFMKFSHSIEMLNHLACGVVALLLQLVMAHRPSVHGYWRLTFSFIIPLVLAGAPTFFISFPDLAEQTLTFYPTIGRSLFKSPTLTASMMSGFLCALPWLAIILPFSNGGVPVERKKGSEAPRTPSRSFYNNQVVSLVGFFVLALILSFWYLPSFTPEYPTRVSVYHEINWETKQSQIVLLYPHAESMDGLKLHLAKQGYNFQECTGTSLGWNPMPALCLKNQPAPPVKAPHIWLNSTYLPDIKKYQIDGIVKPDLGVGRLVTVLPYKPDNVTLGGISLPIHKDRRDFAAEFSLGYGSHDKEYQFRFLIGEEFSGLPLTMRAEALEVSEELEKVIKALPNWAAIWGKSTISLPAALTVTTTLPAYAWKLHH